MRETPKAKEAWCDYLALGPERSLAQLLSVYRNRAGSAPTLKLETLKDWSANHGWQARLKQLEEQKQQSILAEGIASKQFRVDSLAERQRLMKQLIEARASAYRHVPGGDTGLLAEFLGKYGPYYAADTGLLREMRETEKQAAQELGQWVEKTAFTDPTGENPWSGATDAELIAAAARLAGNAANSGGGATE